ncbi:MAG TPA: hypothetical protein VFB45_25075 [Pseudolabrys sp.]|nr:hypothetical protein [Pseudolabrys sp.]
MTQDTRDFAACREEARQCGERAALTADPFARRTYLDIQQRWLRLADSTIAAERVAATCPAARPRVERA